ncbi:MAG: carboxypeptidase regulatory-like domain-containing protein [Rhodocyclaceae bacterium]|nr:carboxypeptidase regulatory-like domain-containing protein [Rhodocyclaceae bacterium]
MHDSVRRDIGGNHVVSVKSFCLIRFFAILAGISLAATASASVLSGIVHDPSGKPKANVFVTAQNGARKLAVTVLSDGAGRYRIDDLFPGQYELRARMSGFGDGVAIDVALGERDGMANLKLTADTADRKTTPGAAWLNALSNEPIKATFVTSCTICHDLASPLTRAPRSAEGWKEIVNKMRAQNDVYSVIVQTDDDKLSAWVAAQKFGARPAPFDAFAKGANVATKARLSEYAVGDVTSWAHDMAVDPRTGVAWVGDYVRDELIAVDPRTGEQKVYPAPVKGTGMHTLNFDREGYLWITFQLADKVARFDTRKGEWRVYEGLAKGTLVHSFALDSEGLVKRNAEGRITLSQFGGNRISLLDPASGDLKEVALPGSANGRPYGIAVDSRGTIWYTKYSENLMGFVDPASGQGKEWAMPRPDSGPHRMHIDNDDNLWIPLSGYGTILRYNTRSGARSEFALPDADAFPYAARYDAKSNRVWVTGNGGNAIYALDPATGKATTFRLPSLLSYGRMISIDYSTGDVWTALSSYPNKHALRDHGLLLRVHRALDLVR